MSNSLRLDGTWAYARATAGLPCLEAAWLHRPSCSEPSLMTFWLLLSRPNANTAEHRLNTQVIYPIKGHSVAF